MQPSTWKKGGKLALLRQKLNSRRRRYRANLEADGPYEAPTRSHREENDRTSTTVECVTSGRSRLALDGDEKKSCQRGMKAKQGSAASNVRRKMRNEDFNAQSNAKSCSSSFSNPDNAHTADVAFPGRSRNTSLNKDISASGRTVETKMRHHVHPPEGDNSVKAHEQYSRRDKQREQKKTSTSSARSSRPESFVSRTKTGGDYLGQPEEAMIANAVVDYGAIQPGEVEKIDVIHCSACDKSFAPPTFEKLCNAFDKNGERKCVKMYNAKRKIYNAAKVRTCSVSQ